MKRLVWLALICMAAPLAASAQGTVANPVAAGVQEMFNRQSKLIVAAVDEMPADKFGYRPTPEQWTFGKIVAHVAQASYFVCSMISDNPVPKDFKVSETDPKDKLQPALQSSFDFCSQAVTTMQDSKLGDTITFFGGRKTPRARAVLELVADLADHYSQLASYLRLNGMLPHSARPRK
jgi:uncharacterized damage-inducible protein DinB